MTHDKRWDDIFTDEVKAMPIGQRKKFAMQIIKEVEAPEIAREKEIRRRERRCFWTWPFGHQFVTTEHYVTIKDSQTCVGCGKRRRV